MNLKGETTLLFAQLALKHPVIFAVALIILLVIGIVVLYFLWQAILAVIFLTIAIATVIFFIIGLKNAKVSSSVKTVLAIAVPLFLVISLVGVYQMIGVMETKFTPDFVEEFNTLDMWNTHTTFFSDMATIGGRLKVTHSARTGSCYMQLKAPINTVSNIRRIDFTVSYDISNDADMWVYLSADGGNHWISSGYRGDTQQYGDFKFHNDAGSILCEAEIPPEYQGNSVDIKISFIFTNPDTEYVDWLKVDWIPATSPNNPPNVPSNPYPSNGDDAVPTEVILTWSGGDVDGDLDYYKVYFEKGDSTPDVFVGTIDTEIWGPLFLDRSSTYYWKIVAYDTSGLSTEGPVWHFSTAGTTPNQPPNQPENPFPMHGATNVDISTPLSWSCTDPNGDDLTYDVYIGTSEQSMAKVSTVTSPTYTPPALQYNTKYYWKIVASDGYLFTQGDVWQFTTGRSSRPTADFTFTANQLTVTFSDASSDVDGHVQSWYWDFGDGTTSNQQNPVHTYADSGAYVVTLTVMDDAGETGTVSKQVSVHLPFHPIADFSYSIIGGNITLTDKSYDTDGEIVAWHWDFGDGKTSYEQNPSHTYKKSGTYTVTLTVTDNSGYTGAKSVEVTVKIPFYIEYMYYLIGGGAFAIAVAVAIMVRRKRR